MRRHASDDFPRYENIHVGVQRRELLDLHAGDEPSAVWIRDRTVALRLIGPDVTVPYV